jgi:unsaturated rhamnogalacturonyl hydrolase
MSAKLPFFLISYLLFSPFLVPVTPTQQSSVSLKSKASAVERTKEGDQPDNPGPVATDLSPRLTSLAIRAAMKKVGDWQLRFGEANFNNDWTFAALYDGLIAASKTTGDPAYSNAVVKFAQAQDWKLANNRFPHADDMALGKAYTALYLEDPEAIRIADTKVILDQLVIRSDDPAKELWWWCDALYMAPPVLARMSEITGDPKYDRYMDQEWDITSNLLYSPEFHLFFRDANYLKQKQANGKPVFWSRGNGWVMAGLVKVLQALPLNDPSRPRYIKQLQEMAAETAAIQSADGLWRTGLLDPAAYRLPEISGSAFFTYAIAYGINEHILDREKFLPVIQKAWAGMLTHIYADGRLGSIQPVGEQPGEFKPSASYVYGVGGFLEAGSELDRLSRSKPG